MADVLFFSYHNTSPWWQYLADNLNFTQSTSLISDLRGEPGICVVDDFYENLRTKNCEHIAIQHFSLPECDDIIRRCRVLRNLDKSQALSMIGAMWLVLDDAIRKEQPKLVVSFIIDRYTLDVLDRILKAYNIPFLAMTASIVPEHVMFMDRGKLFPLRQPEQEEVQKAREQLLNESFAPSYVKTSKKYTPFRYWKTFLYFKLRGVAFQLIRFMKKDKLNLHYLDALNYLDHKPRLLDYKVLGYFNNHWERILKSTPAEKRVFIGLQLLPEASLDYWLDDKELLDNERLVWELCTSLGKAGYTLFVKDHPLQFGFRKREIMQKLMKLPYVVLVPYEAPAGQLIRECSVTVTCTGTIGFQSVLVGACSIVSGAYYSNEEHFVHFHSLKDVAELPEKIAQFQKNNTGVVSEQTVDLLLEKVLAASLPGDLFSFKGFDRSNPEHVARVKSLLDSLNRYLPALIEPQKELEVA